MFTVDVKQQCNNNNNTLDVKHINTPKKDTYLWSLSPCSIETESAIFVSLTCSLLPEDLHSKLILSPLQLVLCRVAAVKRLPVHHHSADYIFDPLKSFGLTPSQCENRVPLKPLLGGMGSVAPLHYCT